MIAALIGNHYDLYLPSEILMLTAFIIMLKAAYKRHHASTQWIAILGLVLAFFTQLSLVKPSTYQTELFLFDGTAKLVSSLLIFVSLLLSLLLRTWLDRLAEQKEEYYILLLLATIGGLVICSSIHFASFFLGLEIMGISIVPMIAYQEENDKALEAGIKYLVLSSIASAFILMSMAVLYLYSGTLSIPELLHKMPTIFSDGLLDSAADKITNNANIIIQNCALVLMLAGITFKLSLVPSHLWAADVFEGSPLPTSALLACISKAAIFTFLLRLFTLGAWQTHAAIIDVVAAVAIASMLVGNLLGLLQKNILRLLAYSSISHFGYILLALLSLFPQNSLIMLNSATTLDLFTSTATIARESAIFYLVAYVVTVLGIFTLLMQIPHVTKIEQLTGLFWSKPLLSSALIIMLLSLAGIPLTIGFVGKFYLTIAAVNGELWWLLAALITGSVLGLFYYLRIILTMIETPSQATGNASTTGNTSSTVSFSHVLVIAIIVFIVLGVGVLPNALSEVIRLLV